MRLDRFLSERLPESREEIKKNIRAGKVTIDGQAVRDPGVKINGTESVQYRGEVIDAEAYEYWLLYKTAGYVTARTDEEHQTVMELVPSKRKGLSPVGRLDKDTEGVLLITDDGELNHRLVSPKYHVDKKYYAECDRAFPENAKEILERPIEFKDYTAEGGVFEQITENSCYLTIAEGKFHQVKRMIAKCGTEVTYLRRESFGPLTLINMQPGECRKLEKEEIEALKESAGLISEE